MRTIDATLLANQKALDGRPTRSLIIGTSPNTVDISSYVLAYRYAEADEQRSLIVLLDNKAGTFNSLAGDLAYIAQGATVELKRGLTIAGTDYVEELPRTWLEGIYYGYSRGQSICVLTCIDWLGKLARWYATTEQEWESTSATTILEWILDQVGLTRLAGDMTAFSLDFVIGPRESGEGALKRLVCKMPEYLYPGLDAEIKWKNIDGADASVYKFGWNAEHSMLATEAGDAAWEINSITVNGRGGTTGSASDATQIALVGTRHWTIYDESLSTNALCEQRAIAELDLYEANSIAGIIRCRPCHGLELLDVVTIDDPPWGGADTVGRVIQWVEEYSHRGKGKWEQIIALGHAPCRDPGRAISTRRSTSRPSPTPITPDDPLLVPLRGIILWPGAIVDIPANWVLCDGTNGTPDLRNVFIVGAGDAYTVDDTGGEDASNLEHRHASGGYAAAEDSHTHDVTGSTAADSHSHGDGTLAAASDAHTHALNTTQYGPPSGATVLTTATVTESDAHTHDVTGSTDSDEHSHGDGTLAAASDAHTHDVAGYSGYAGSTTQENRPSYYAMNFIMRIA